MLVGARDYSFIFAGGSSHEDGPPVRLQTDPAVPNRARTATGATETDADLIVRIRRGERAALAQLFRDLYGALCDFACSYVGSPDEAEDLVSTVFTRLWANRASWSAPAGIRAYLFRAVRNGAINHVRDQASHATMATTREIPALSAEPAAAVEQADIITAVWAAADRLPAMQRLVISLRCRQEFSWEEIVEVTGLSQAAVLKQYGRGVERLKQLIRHRLG